MQHANAKTSRQLVHVQDDSEDIGTACDWPAENFMKFDSRILTEAFAIVDEGIGIYDASDRLVAFNHRYQDCRNAIGGEVKLGISWPDLVRESVRCGRKASRKPHE